MAQRLRRWRRRGAEEGPRAGPASAEERSRLAVAASLLQAPVADRRNWTIPRLCVEIEAREGVRISRSQLSKALRDKSFAGGGPGTR